MRVALAVVALCCLAVFVQAQTKPKISETFEARVFFEVSERNGTHFIHYGGSGLWAEDQAKGHSLRVDTFEDRRSRYEQYVLHRYDLNATYELDSEHRNHCNKSKLSGEAPKVWAWVEQATFRGKVEHRGKTVLLWGFNEGYATLELAVDAANPNTPVFLRRNSSEAEVFAIFERFTTQVPVDLFNVPSICKNAEIPEEEVTPILECRNRNDMIAVGNAWVAAHVPYNQGGRHDGYRTDCSGFVSAAWALAQPGPTTQQFPTYSHRISKDELLPGDAILNAGEHVVLFGGWANAAKTQYIAYEETNPKTGMRRETNVPYPYWYEQNKFIPYRSNSVC